MVNFTVREDEGSAPLPASKWIQAVASATPFFYPRGMAAKKTSSAKRTAKTASGVTMPDAGFHLAVLGALMEAELVSEEAVERFCKPIAEALEGLDEDDERGRLRLVLAHLHTMPLPAAKTAKIAALDFDGGNSVYMTLEEIAGTYSGGETDAYCAESLEGIGELVGLERLDIDSHGNPSGDKVVDLAPLAGHPRLAEIMVGDCRNADALETLPNLKRVRVLGSMADVGPKGVLERLTAKGVEVATL